MTENHDYSKPGNGMHHNWQTFKKDDKIIENSRLGDDQFSANKGKKDCTNYLPSKLKS